jgi:phospholipase C
MQTRRSFLRRGLTTGLTAGVGLAGAASLSDSIDEALAVQPPKRAKLEDIEHVVFLMQENRSFDHYYGTLRGVRGFDDPDAPKTAGRSVFNQVDPDLADNPEGYVLPFRLNTFTTSGQGVADQSHAWAAQQGSWAEGTNVGFVTAHRVGNGNGPETGGLCMGYYTREDIPFHYALADAFTICDGYHCSVLGPTNPNRIMAMSGTVDAAGVMGGPCLDDSQNNGQLHWTSYPERLEAAGISWSIYQESDNDTNNMMNFFAGVDSAPKSSRLYQCANTIIPTAKGAQPGPALAARLRRDVMHNRLPQVSWILAGTMQCEHPNATPGVGAGFVSSVLSALTSNPKVWQKTVVFYHYDENDGFFDHVIPPTAPAGTPDEYIDAESAAKNFGQTLGFPGPVGLGFRVPMTVISPFSRGGFVCSDLFDHTSTLQFLEKRFGIAEPNISAWRRDLVGDLTATLGCYTSSQFRVKNLPNAMLLAQMAVKEVDTLPAPTVPKDQSMPTQEPGTRPQIGAECEMPDGVEPVKSSKPVKKHSLTA